MQTARNLNNLRTEPKQSRALFTFDAILDAAEIVLKNEGFERLTTNHVAEMSGYSVGTVYRYFSCKASLLDELRLRHCKDIEEAIVETLQKNKQENCETSLRAIIAAIIDIHVRDAELHRLIFAKYRDHSLNGQAGMLRIQLPETARNELASLFDELDAPAAIAMPVCNEIIHSLTHAAIIDQRIPLVGDDLVEQILGVVLAYCQRNKESKTGAN